MYFKSSFFFYKHRRRYGLTIVELLVALAILTLGVTTLANLTLSARFANDRQSRRLKATAYAQGFLTTLRVAGYDAVIAEVKATSPSLPLNTFEPIPELPGTEWRVTATEAPTTGARRLAVEVAARFVRGVRPDSNEANYETLVLREAIVDGAVGAEEVGR